MKNCKLCDNDIKNSRTYCNECWESFKPCSRENCNGKILPNRNWSSICVGCWKVDKNLVVVSFDEAYDSDDM